MMQTSVNKPSRRGKGRSSCFSGVSMSNALALRKRDLPAYLLNLPGGKQTTAHCSWLRHGDGQWAAAIIWISWASRVERVTAAVRASCIRLRLYWWLQRLRSRPGPGSLREEAEVTSVIISVYRFVTFLYSRDSVLVSLKLTYHLYPGSLLTSCLEKLTVFRDDCCRRKGMQIKLRIDS